MKSRKKLFFWIIVIAVAIIGYVYFSQRKQHAEPKMYYSYTMQSTTSTGALGIHSTELTSQTLLSGTLCVGEASKISKIDLYMPDMGHGSSPPVVSKTAKVPSKLKAYSTKTDYGCYNISKMEMFMPGLWQVRVFYENGNSGTFDITLNK